MSKRLRKETSKKTSKKKAILISIISIFALIIAIGGIYVVNLSSKVDRVEINREDNGQEPARKKLILQIFLYLGQIKVGQTVRHLIQL